MNWLIRSLLYTLLMLYAVTAYPQSQRGTMRFNETEWNFGRMEELGGKVSHVFEFTNTGGEPFVIESVSTSCGCTTPEYTRSPIMPGGKGKVTVTFDPDGQPGAVRKEVYILSNNRKNRNTLVIRAEVNPRPRTVEDEYPISLDNGIRVDYLDVGFEYIPRGTTKSMVINYFNSGNSTVTLDVRPESESSVFKVSLSSKELKSKERGIMTVTYDLRERDVWSRVMNRFDLIVNGQRSRLKFSASGIAVDDFTKMSSLELTLAPKAIIPQLYHNLDAVTSGSTVSTGFVISNEGEQTLEVRYVGWGEGISSDLKVGEKIKTGERKEFKVDFTPRGRAGDKVNGVLTVIFNDPSRPFREFRIATTIK